MGIPSPTTVFRVKVLNTAPPNWKYRPGTTRNLAYDDIGLRWNYITFRAGRNRLAHRSNVRRMEDGQYLAHWARKIDRWRQGLWFAGWSFWSWISQRRNALPRSLRHVGVS
ncbi:hypothetical protein DL95DRAFT_389750 [Leptodontidium sp. 2 PMI_412]|nr:hypothetical protein DL95DRAFT_389750 [Leptodontidium sp. 2 PMI_412]